MVFSFLPNVKIFHYIKWYNCKIFFFLINEVVELYLFFLNYFKWLSTTFNGHSVIFLEGVANTCE